MSHTASLSSASPGLTGGITSPDKHMYASIAITKSHDGSITSHTSLCPPLTTLLPTLDLLSVLIVPPLQKAYMNSTALSPPSLASLSSKVIFLKHKSTRSPVTSTSAQKDTERPGLCSLPMAVYVFVSFV